MLVKREKKKPKYAPTNKDGAKLPPLPPLPRVRPVAIALTKINIPTKLRTNHSLLL